ncbi:MAG: hypothetical protein V7607_3402 [Solirubrobacteraceae bacterium]
MTLRVALLGTDNTHGHQFAGFLNGWDSAVPIPTHSPKYGFLPGFYTWAKGLREAEHDEATPVPSPEARVTSIWCPDRAEAELLARACGIERCAAEPEDALHGADAVLVLTEDAASHLALAQPALERGLPTFVDKPLTHDPASSQRLAELAARRGAPWFTASALRFSPSLRRFAATLPHDVGRVHAVYAQAAGPVETYGIHALETANQLVSLVGAHVVQGFGAPGRGGALVVDADGVTAVIDVLQTSADPPAHAVVYGERGQARWLADDTAASMLELVTAFVDMALTGTPPLPPEEGLELSALAWRVARAAAPFARRPAPVPSVLTARASTP